jgi:topoisomerase IV subunit B
MSAKPSSASASEYSEGSIRVLKGLEPVKQRRAAKAQEDSHHG